MLCCARRPDLIVPQGAATVPSPRHPPALTRTHPHWCATCCCCCAACVCSPGGSDEVSRQLVLEVFDKVDNHGDGRISFREVRSNLRANQSLGVGPLETRRRLRVSSAGSSSSRAAAAPSSSASLLPGDDGSGGDSSSSSASGALSHGVVACVVLARSQVYVTTVPQNFTLQTCGGSGVAVVLVRARPDHTVG